MLIECPDCRSRYRFNEGWIRGFKGAKVNCRKCGSEIVVLNPHNSPSFPPEEAEPADAAEDSGAPPTGGSAGTVFDGDLPNDRPQHPDSSTPDPSPAAAPPFANETVYAPPVEVLPPERSETWRFAKPPHRPLPSQKRFSRSFSQSVYDMVLLFAILVVVLLFGSLFGYVLARFLYDLLETSLG